MIATLDGSDLVYTPTQLRGYVIDSPELFADAKWRWEAIRSEALPQGAIHRPDPRVGGKP